ncbi:hypothetical protein ACFE04_017416 [Oxalis oulophora]
MARFIRIIILLLVISKPIIAEYHSPCEVIYAYFPFCLPFLVGSYYKPSKKCCDHIAKLNVLANRSKKKPQLFCSCIEAITQGTTPPMLAYRINELPLKCKTHLSFPISDSMDCSKV